MDLIKTFTEVLRPFQQAMIVLISIVCVVGIVMFSIGKHTLGAVCVGFVFSCLAALFFEKVWFIRRDSRAQALQIARSGY